MPKTNINPIYRKHKSTGQAAVTLNGKHFYLGPHGTAASRREYDRLVSEWLANGRRIPTGSYADISVLELINRYWKFAKTYYITKNGEYTQEIPKIKTIVSLVKRMYRDTYVPDFGPLAMKAVRERMLNDGYKCGTKRHTYSRLHINQSMQRIVRMFAWGVEQQLVEPSVLHALQAVKGLRKGRSQARDTKPIRPVPDEYVDGIKEHVTSPVWAIIELQRLTGMRGGEVVIMRPRDIDMVGKVWLYRPSSHKAEYHDYERVIDLGPKAQKIIEPFLKRSTESFLFSPAEATAERYAKANSHRRKNQKSNKPATKRKIGDAYTPASYRRAVKYGCKQAGVPDWHPHQLRHNAATRFRREHGIEIARIILGHRSPVMTALYAEVDRSKARDVMLKIG